MWDVFQATKNTGYRELRDLMSKALNGSKDANLPLLKSLINQLYREVLDRHVDFIATTPVPASKRFSGLYKPDIVIFDESPHAREASTMIAMAHYEPLAWIFSGDHRQTRPFVASDDARDNPWAPQMLVSMMERANRTGVIGHSLLINHRAYAGLQRMASGMFYNNKMISGHKERDLYPPSVRHLQRFLERFLPGAQKCCEPRLLAFDGGRGEIRTGTSWHNPAHIDWVMQRVQELLTDAMFKQVRKNERGTILIISPYKESYKKYKDLIKGLPSAWQARLNIEARVEARTVDTVQGGEADFVFLDMVRSVATDFTDDPNRLNVALTRARQAEVILMHPESESANAAASVFEWHKRANHHDTVKRGTWHLSRIYAHCHELNQIVDITVGGPRPMTRAPAEERAYQDHLSHQKQFDDQRVAYGLESLSAGLMDQGYQPVGGPDITLTDDGLPESIYASQFAGLAEFMQSILDEKTAKLEGEKQYQQSQGRDRPPFKPQMDATRQQHPPHGGFDGLSQLTANSQHTTQLPQGPHQACQDVQAQNNAGRSEQSGQTGQRLALNGTSAVKAANGTDDKTQSPDMSQSRWNIVPQGVTTPGVPSQGGAAMLPAQPTPSAGQDDHYKQSATGVNKGVKGPDTMSAAQNPAALIGAGHGGSVNNPKNEASVWPSGSNWW